MKRKSEAASSDHPPKQKRPTPAADAPPREKGAGVRLRVRGPGGQAEVNADDLMPLGELKREIARQIGLPAEQQRILAGFPPKVLEGGEQATLRDLKLRSGEQLTVQKGDNVGKIVQGHTKGRYVPPCDPKGSFKKREMPGDNSCLFHSASYVLENRSSTHGAALRKQCAEVVLANPQKFTAAMLGQHPQAYAQWIMHKDTWGGGIELSILSFLYTTEIMALDVTTCKLYRFGESEGYTTRVFLMFSGKHYDAMALAPYGGCKDTSKDQVMFSSTDETVLTRAQHFVQSEYGDRKKGS